MPELLLASSSPYRAELLGRLGLPFSAVAPDIDETPLPAEAPADLVDRLARGKAAALAGSHPSALIIGSDQVAVLDGRVLGKPLTVARARRQLAEAAGQEVAFLTAVCLLDAASGTANAATVTTRVKLRPLSEREIERYVALEQPLDCAGALKSEGLGIVLCEAIKGDDPTALIGLPLITLTGLLRTAGVDPL